MVWATHVKSRGDGNDDGVKLMSVEDAKAVVAGIEGKLSDAMARRDKVVQDISVAHAKAEATVGINEARNSLVPLNKRAKAIDNEIALLRIDISLARRQLELATAHAAGAKAKQAAERGETGRLAQLEIRAPDGRVIRQFHKSVDAAREALSPGYEVIGEVISGNIVSPIGPGARSFMKALLSAHGDELLAFLGEHGIIGSTRQLFTVIQESDNPTGTKQ
jgi:hypothetical protein